MRYLKTTVNAGYMTRCERLNIIALTLKDSNNQAVLGPARAPMRKTSPSISALNISKNENNSNLQGISTRDTRRQTISTNTTLATNKARSEQRTSSKISSKVSGISHLEVTINNTRNIQTPMKISTGHVLPAPIRNTTRELRTLSMMRARNKATKIMGSNIAGLSTMPKMIHRIRRQQSRKPKRMSFTGLTIRRTTRRSKSSSSGNQIQTLTLIDSRPGECVQNPSQRPTPNMSQKRAAFFTT